MSRYIATHSCLEFARLRVIGGVFGAIAVFVAALVNPATAAESAKEPPSNGCGDCTPLNLDFQDLCDTSSKEIRDGASPKQVMEAIKQEIRSQVPKETKRGIRRLGENASRCYRVAKTDVHLSCERNGKSVANEDVFLNYEAVDISGHDPDVVPEVMSADYKKVVQSASSHSEFFGRLTVVIYWKKTPIDRIVLTADKPLLSPGESTTVRARLVCGKSHLKHQQVRFAVTSGPGSLKSHAASTGADAEATTQFTSGEEGTSIIEARYEDVTEQIEIQTQGYLWDVEVVYEANVPPARYRNGGTLHCSATFQDLPLNKIDGVLYQPKGRDRALFLPRFATARVGHNTWGGSAPRWVLAPGHPNPKRDIEPQPTPNQERLTSVRLQLGSAPWDDSAWGWAASPDTRYGVFVVVPMTKVRPREPFSLQTTFADSKGSYKAKWNFTPKKGEAKPSGLGGNRTFGQDTINLPRILNLLGK
ncbi:MAG: hypothetical protein H8E44_13060 [Planctomycetes bacterium]|nr:hypothetical protein [Planctomycetota bacterium]MBL7037763.1 hypothetical protein [Pirellulaceae bacterium]